MKYLVAVISAVFTLSVQAGDILSEPDAVKAIFSDKTVQARHLKKDRSWEQYFAADGTMQRYSDEGEKRTGKWYINEGAEHCIKWDHKANEHCRAIMKGNRDGVYFRVKEKGDSKIKLVRFKRFREGNKLKKPGDE